MVYQPTNDPQLVAALRIFDRLERQMTQRPDPPDIRETTACRTAALRCEDSVRHIMPGAGLLAKGISPTTERALSHAWRIIHRPDDGEGESGHRRE